ncbi:MAG: precorrin-3B synthase [Roseiarcus sp.]
MSAHASPRKGWCPGALAPMPAADGLIVRVRLSGRRLAPASVAALARCAAQFGNGAIELSARANLQMRGVGEAALPALRRRLDGLGLLDANAGAERIRNIVASPLADLDPSAALDVAPIVAALEGRLREDRALRRLPAKFGFLVDGGGVLPLGDVEADVRIEAFSGPDGPRCAVRPAGAGELAGVCTPAEAAGVAVALAQVCADEAGAAERMRALIARRGAGAVFAAAGLAPVAAPAAQRIAVSRSYLGVNAFGAAFVVGAAAPLGRMTARDLALLAAEARRNGAADVRLTPWRALLVTGLDRAGADRLAASLGTAGFILDAADRRLGIAACVGAPACAHAARSVAREALAFAPLLPAGRGTMIHVSGCAKGCAHARAAPLTLVATPEGYDLVRDGKAADAPAATGLSPEAVGSLLALEFGGAR